MQRFQAVKPDRKYVNYCNLEQNTPKNPQKPPKQQKLLSKKNLCYMKHRVVYSITDLYFYIVKKHACKNLFGHNHRNQCTHC